MKIVIEYDSASGQMKDKTGTYIGIWQGIVSFEPEKEFSIVNDLIQLKAAGFTAEEMIAMGIVV